MGAAARVFVLPELAPVATAAAVEMVDPAGGSRRIGRDALSLAVATAAVARLGLLPVGALRDAAAEAGAPEVAAVEAGLEIAAASSAAH